MILDQLLLLADSMTVGTSTAVVVSTSYVDTVAKGDDYCGLFLLSQVETSLVSGTALATCEFRVMHSDSTAATSFVTLVSSGEVDDAEGGAVGYLSKVRIPPGAKRYIQGGVRCSVVPVGATGTVSQWLCKDVDVNAQLIA